MDKIFEILDLKRWILITIPVLIVILGIYTSLNYIYSFISIKEKFRIEDYIGNYSLLLNLDIPKKARKINFEIFDYLNLIKFESNRKIITATEEKKEASPPVYKINLVYIRDGKKYVVINGKILTEGSKISDKEYIVKIEKDGVLLNGYWGARWIKL